MGRRYPDLASPRDCSSLRLHSRILLPNSSPQPVVVIAAAVGDSTTFVVVGSDGVATTDVASASASVATLHEEALPNPHPLGPREIDVAASIATSYAATTDLVVAAHALATTVAYVVASALVVYADPDLASRPASVLNSYCCISSYASRSPRSLPSFPTHSFTLPCLTLT